MLHILTTIAACLSSPKTQGRQSRQDNQQANSEKTYCLVNITENHSFDHLGLKLFSKSCWNRIMAKVTWWSHVSMAGFDWESRRSVHVSKWIEIDLILLFLRALLLNFMGRGPHAVVMVEHPTHEVQQVSGVTSDGPPRETPPVTHLLSHPIPE